VSRGVFNASELRTYLKRSLPEYMVPPYLVEVEQIPLTANGKVDRKLLLGQTEGLQNSPLQVLPETEIEYKLANVWRKVLGIPSPSVLDSFFDLGGHSLKALVLKAELEKIGHHVNLTEIYNYKSIRALAAYIESAKEPESLIQLKEELVSWLRREKDGVYELVSYQVRGVFEETQNINVLYSDDVGENRVKSLKQIMNRKVSKDLLPHYIMPLYRKNGMDSNETIDEEVFYQHLGLNKLERDEAITIHEKLKDEYRQMNRLIKKGDVVREYPLGAVQQMQIKFQTPPSIVFFKLDEYVDYTLLDQSYAQLVEHQGLLRSVPVQGEQCICWKEYATPSSCQPKLHLIDVSDSNSNGPFMDMLQDFIHNTRYEGERILYQMVLLKRNLREHYVIGLLHHAICDRVTAEIIEHQMLSCYRGLLQGQVPPSDERKTFVEYVTHIQSGPRGISEEELISDFELKSFYQSKQDILKRLKHRTSNEAFLFDVAIPVKEHSLELALSVYTKGLQLYLETDHFPLLFLYDGRRYEGSTYYNTIGEFIDFVPLFIDAGWTPNKTMRSVRARLDLLKDKTLNFMHLLVDPTCRYNWSNIKRFVQFGEQYEYLDLFMFNYLGNSAKGNLQESYDDTIIKQPNPLPIYSLFNCIAKSCSDGLIFSFRCSYKIDVEEVRRAFLKVASELNT
ncbi:phosphopantetheine-binding protein, partial [Paenibacillus xylanexedens]|uniref:phosphopantetheine-binding protein n=1 Tax=Paenibacillus xylanexedens TaxID=528191 RepID=UPI0021B6751E